MRHTSGKKRAKAGNTAVHADMPIYPKGILGGRQQPAEAQESTLADPVLTLAQVEKLLSARSPAAQEERFNQFHEMIAALVRRIARLEALATQNQRPAVFKLTLSPEALDDAY